MTAVRSGQVSKSAQSPLSLSPSALPFIGYLAHGNVRSFVLLTKVQYVFHLLDKARK